MALFARSIASLQRPRVIAWTPAYLRAWALPGSRSSALRKLASAAAQSQS